MEEPPPSTFNHIFARYHVAVLRYAERRLPSSTTAEDITADVMTAAWERWAAGKPVELPWLYRVAANKVADYYRREERRATVEAALFRAVEEPENSENAEMQQHMLRQAILSLKQREREAVVLTYWERLPADEVASALRCSTATVWALLSRARKKLHRILTGGTPFSLGETERIHGS